MKKTIQTLASMQHKSKTHLQTQEPMNRLAGRQANGRVGRASSSSTNRGVPQSSSPKDPMLSRRRTGDVPATAARKPTGPQFSSSYRAAANRRTSRKRGGSDEAKGKAGRCTLTAPGKWQKAISAMKGLRRSKDGQ